MEQSPDEKIILWTRVPNLREQEAFETFMAHKITEIEGTREFQLSSDEGESHRVTVPVRGHIVEYPYKHFTIGHS